jgi:hypothetical protein
MKTFTLPGVPAWEYTPNGDFRKLHRRIENEMEKRLPTKLKEGYHNFDHTIDVVVSGNLFGTMENISPEQWRILGLALYGHDTGQMLDDDEFGKILSEDNYDSKGHEIRGQQWVYDLGKGLFTPYEKDAAAKLVPYTTTFVNGKFTDVPEDNLLARILCDADVDNLGRTDFFEKGELLRQELGIKDKEKWYNMTKGLMELHEFYTNSASALRNLQKQRNYDALVQRIEKYKTKGI